MELMQKVITTCEMSENCNYCPFVDYEGNFNCYFEREPHEWEINEIIKRLED